MSSRILALLLLTVLTGRADVVLPVLTVKGEVYSNVTVTAVTDTDVFFTYTNGMGNAKLKDLDPKLQSYFNYDPVKGAAQEKKEAQDKVLYHQQLLLAKPVPAAADSDDDFVAPVLYAKSFRGQRAPDFAVDQWLTDAPDIRGKFVLIEFWATRYEPCRQCIPLLNALYIKYGNRMAVIGITDETAAVVQKMTDPPIYYAVASDPQTRMLKALEIRGLPHCILIDPQGIVRYEGIPAFLNQARLEHLLDKYK
jgi:cytochrome c biogenesis protein CcmG/thiol:disulfide interchange protein DsbE